MKYQALAWLVIPLLLTAVSVEPNTDIFVELYPEREVEVRMRSLGQENSLSTGVSTEYLTWFWENLPFYWPWRWAKGTSSHQLSANRTSHRQFFSEI